MKLYMNKTKISKYTVQIRYKIITNLIKYLTPNLYFKASIMGFVGKSRDNEFDSLAFVPRPSIKIMRNYFRNRLVNGAEVGVLRGDNAISILNELNIKKLYLIDIWNDYKNQRTKFANKENYDIVLKRFKKDKRVEIIKAFSKEGSEKIENCSLDFVYIDANHGYKHVYNDMNCWYPKIRKGGILAGHDVFSCIDVIKAVKNWCIKNKTNFEIKLPDWYFIKNNRGK